MKLKTRLLRPIQICSKVVGQPLEESFIKAYGKSMERLPCGILSGTLRMVNGEYDILP